MPIYEYQCTSCHHQFELMQKVSDPAVKKCPKCFEDTATKLVSAAGFQLKGTGWYATDFKNKGKSESKPEEKKTDTDSANQPAKDSSSTTTTTKGKDD